MKEGRLVGRRLEGVEGGRVEERWVEGGRGREVEVGRRAKGGGGEWRRKSKREWTGDGRHDAREP